ncbi:hypothetical protein [Bradyrhizobium roseum]|uniref:hypothetical protein n=1 Tax=Bradyrhizobium roseum TaxID=3056648 RepID=UPI00262F5D4E|nr:hypothetical protein [Bradyrhizobium roseus]WKA27910.1 hypothetical protein QUH67_30830 [Bradyrhizobium roseus]
MAKQQIMRVLGAAIVLIALSLAPSVARAHTGHPHLASVHDGQSQAVSQVASQAAFDEIEQSAGSASLRQARWKADGMPPASDRNCAGDCCLSACAACCATGLPSPMAFIAFPRAITRIAFGPSPMWPEREPESLRRPPKTFI